MRKALTSLPWVRQVQEDFSRKEATVTVIADQYDSKPLLEALEKEGFQAKVEKEGGGS